MSTAAAAVAAQATLQAEVLVDLRAPIHMSTEMAESLHGRKQPFTIPTAPLRPLLRKARRDSPSSSTAINQIEE